MAARSMQRFLGAPINVVKKAFAEPSSTSPGIPPLPLTFGIELEFILAVRSNLRDADSWLEIGDFTNDCGRNKSTRRNEEEHFGSQAYREIVHGKRVLERANCPVVESYDDNIDITSWNIESDITVYSQGPHEIETKLSHRVGRKERWDAKGLELVSRVLPVPTKLGALSSDPSLMEVENYVRALQGKDGDPFGVYTNVTCGLHVHIGQDPKRSNDGTAALPLDVLQHLSFMLIQFEPLISSLHPASRRDYLFSPANGMVGSNTMAFRQTRHICVSELPLIESIEKAIFSQDMDVIRLAKLMSETLDGYHFVAARLSRYKNVNFTRLAKVDKKVDKTLEFRQHAGTMKVDHILHWILFVTSLVRAAEKKARQNKPATPAAPLTPRTALSIHQDLPFPRQQGNKYRLKCQSQFDEFERLFDLLEFEPQTRQYWLGRYARLNPDEVAGFLAGQPQKEIAETLCPVCCENMTYEQRAELSREIRRRKMIWDVEDASDEEEVGEVEDEGLWSSEDGFVDHESESESSEKDWSMGLETSPVDGTVVSRSLDKALGRLGITLNGDNGLRGEEEVVAEPAGVINSNSS